MPTQHSASAKYEGVWFTEDDQFWPDGKPYHYFIVQCPECLQSLVQLLSWPHAKVMGLEGAEEFVEKQARRLWMEKADCHHIIFKFEEIRGPDLDF
jgi:hypothetical protein